MALKIENYGKSMGKFLNRFGAALIDMDGVLYDSMKWHTLAWKKMMESVGVECDRDEFYLYEGMTGEATIDLLFRRAFGHGVTSEQAKELYAVKSRYFREFGKKEPMEGADRMLGALERARLRRVLVTGSGQASLLDNINADYPGAFLPGDRVTAHDVVSGKPSPEPYQKGAEIAGADPADCIVIENAPLGVRAGKAAGCFTVAVTTGPIPRSEFEKENADMIFSSMPEFADWLEKELSQPEPDNRLIVSENPEVDLTALVESLRPDKFFIITDVNVERDVLPKLGRFAARAAGIKVVAAGEESKNLDTLAEIWSWLSSEGATRRSVIVNIGGGVVTDLGGFAAACFKRGIRTVNLPTSVLGAADAAIGGKTGIDFHGLKNEIGAFHLPEAVVIAPAFFSTLPREQAIEGFAEVVKTALISSASLWKKVIEPDAPFRPELLGETVAGAGAIKSEVVGLDPEEKGLRRILNFGHTAGHAFESLAARRGTPVGHGTAVAWGMMVALELSRDRCGFPAEVVEEYREKILNRYYAPNPFGEGDREEIVELMGHDKKNSVAGKPEFILLRNIGEPIV